MTAENSNEIKSIRARRRDAGLTSLGLPNGYRQNPALLQSLAEEPRRGYFLRKPKNWVEGDCLFCGARMISRNRKFCSANCRRSYEFRQKHPLQL